jgi:hypothetical protein
MLILSGSAWPRRTGRVGCPRLRPVHKTPAPQGYLPGSDAMLQHQPKRYLESVVMALPLQRNEAVVRIPEMDVSVGGVLLCASDSVPVQSSCPALVAA